MIEYFLGFIPGLSEKFLYGNDDTFFGKPITPDYFFDGDKPIVRVKNLKCIEHKNYFSINKSNKKYIWIDTIFNSLDILNNYYLVNNYYQPTHNIESYSKKTYLSTFQKFKHELQKCFNNRFRTGNDIERIIFSLDAVYSGKADLKIVSNPKPWRRRLNFIKTVNWETYCAVDTNIKDQKTIIKYRPKLFCLNSDTSCSIEDKLQVKQFMEKLFPTPSKFEI